MGPFSPLHKNKNISMKMEIRKIADKMIRLQTEIMKDPRTKNVVGFALVTVLAAIGFSLAQPAGQPAKLTSPASFPITMDGKQVGSTTLPIGAAVTVLETANGKVRVKANVGEAWLPEADVLVENTVTPTPLLVVEAKLSNPTPTPKPEAETPKGLKEGKSLLVITSKLSQSEVFLLRYLERHGVTIEYRQVYTKGTYYEGEIRVVQTRFATNEEREAKGNTPAYLVESASELGIKVEGTDPVPTKNVLINKVAEIPKGLNPELIIRAETKKEVYEAQKRGVNPYEKLGDMEYVRRAVEAGRKPYELVTSPPMVMSIKKDPFCSLIFYTLYNTFGWDPKWAGKKTEQPPTEEEIHTWITDVLGPAILDNLK